MLIECSIRNYRSFRDRATLSMEAAPVSSHPSEWDERPVVACDPALRLLPCAAIYGANACGKSNLVAAVAFMRRFVLTSADAPRFGRAIDVEPFRLSIETDGQPSEFEMVFVIDGVQHRYGFAADRRAVVKEWLHRLGTTRETTLFTRTGSTIKVNRRAFPEGRGLDRRTPPQALFLSVVAQFNGSVAQRITEWFAALDVNAGVADRDAMARAIAECQNSPWRPTVERLLQQLDTGIERLAAPRSPLDPATPSSQQPSERVPVETRARAPLHTVHQRFDAEGHPTESVSFTVERHESAGTQRLLTLLHSMVRALQAGGVLVVDEFDARFHPVLSAELVRWFNDPATNPRHAQLIFTTHNTHLLSADLFRRDQVWFVEKSRQGASLLHSLLEYRITGAMGRAAASLEKDYLLGRYGAVPCIGPARDVREAPLESSACETTHADAPDAPPRSLIPPGARRRNRR